MTALLRLLRDQSTAALFLATCSNVFAAATTTFLLMTVSRYIAQGASSAIPWWQFILLSVGSILFQITTHLAVSSLTRRAVSRLRLDLAQAILNAPLADIEKLGTSQFHSTVTEAISQIGGALPSVVNLVRDFSFVLFVLIVLSARAPAITVALVGLIFIGGLAFQPLRRRAASYESALRKCHEQSFFLIRDLVGGIKQLKLNSQKAEKMQVSLGLHEQKIMDLARARSLVFGIGNSVYLTIYFGLIGVIMYASVQDYVTAESITLFVLAIVFLMGPLQQIAGSAQITGQAVVALEKVRAVRTTLEQASTLDRSKIVAESNLHPPEIHTLELRNITHTYRTTGRNDFSLGPVSFTLKAGEVIFITGGNGSGKTTLAKVLTGLYTPETGQILVNGVPITPSNRSWYTNCCSAVFYDFCLFEALAGSDSDVTVSNRTDILQHLGLSDAIAAERGLLAQVASFSAGERRRAALLLAYMDDRPIFVFDELSADLDPLGKDLFYQKILGDLRSRGKLVIVITHDVRFFSAADQMIILERGKRPIIQAASSKSEVCGGSFQLQPHS